MTLTQAQDKSIFRYNALVAQSVECILGKDEVSSSILLKGSTKNQRTYGEIRKSFFFVLFSPLLPVSHVVEFAPVALSLR